MNVNALAIDFVPSAGGEQGADGYAEERAYWGQHFFAGVRQDVEAVEVALTGVQAGTDSEAYSGANPQADQGIALAMAFSFRGDRGDAGSI